MHTPEIEHYLKLADSKSLVVLFYLLQIMDKEYVVNTTLERVAMHCSVTKVTVNRIFQRLYKSGFMEKIKNGQYQLRKIF